jgi:hypothetical protein
MFKPSFTTKGTQFLGVSVHEPHMFGILGSKNTPTEIPQGPKEMFKKKA